LVKNIIIVTDAAKRRTLPPWIREGLEKMEREKQKREEREKADMEREEASRRRLQEEQTALEELEAEKSGIPKRSKFVNIPIKICRIS
jgi:splicing factor, arginine/serine-rich 18